MHSDSQPASDPVDNVPLPARDSTLPKPHDTRVFQARAAFEEALIQLAKLTRDEVAVVLGDRVLDRIIRSIAPTRIEEPDKSQLIYDYLLRYKDGLQLLALARLAITQNYSIEGIVNGHRVYVSPNHVQWFEDGVMFLQGQERFGGLIGLYRQGNVMFGIAARDTAKGEALGPDDFLFVDAAEATRMAAQRPRVRTEQLDSAAAALSALLNRGDPREHSYQQFLQRHPWALGAQYSSITAHEAFDDKNIPDFSGVRVRDGARDILEIKSPFLSLFRTDGDLNSDFNDAWNQTERCLESDRTIPGLCPS